MKVVDLELSGAKLIWPKVFNDERGFFLESYNKKLYSDNGINTKFVQDNHSRSIKNTLRGLHYQSKPGQAKLIRVVSGKIFDVIVDLRPKSDTFGKWAGAYLDDQLHGQMFCPVGCAHGFFVISDFAEVCYKVSSLYNAKTECSLRYNDPDLAIQWPAEVFDPIISNRDNEAESFADYKKKND